MRSLIAIAALVLLASCADTPSKPTTTGGSSSGSGKIVTATPEQPFECDDDLILEPHLPEECIPPEPPEPVKPAEPPEPDPIVGTYRVFYRTIPTDQTVIRIYSDGTAVTRNYGLGNRRKEERRWVFDSPRYHVYGENKAGAPERYVVSWQLQSVAGEPDLISQNRNKAPLFKFNDYEGLKLSNDPDFQFDLFKLGSNNNRDWGCFNIGRQEIPIFTVPAHGGDTVRLYAESLSECEALCRPAVDLHFSSDPQQRRSLEDMTCPEDRR